MSRKIHIVVSCTDRKKLHVPKRLHLRGARSADLRERAELWGKRVDAEDCDTIPATQLYSGDHWSVSQNLQEVARNAGLSPDLWVCSAGYGLVSAQDPVKPYSATFARGHIDSVCRHARGVAPDEAAEAWWEELARSPYLKNGKPRRLRELRRNRNELLLVVASPPYLAAIGSDLATAAGGEAARVLVVCAGSPPNRGLAALLLPADARFQRRLGGARQSLNVRIARDVIESMGRTGDQDFARVRARFARKLREEQPVTSYDRKPLSDEAVREFIRRRLAENSKVRHTPLLRELRESGQACEQRRFRDLFFEEKEKVNA